jgi:hypothetical protein
MLGQRSATAVCIVRVHAQTLGLRFTLRMNRDVESSGADLIRYFTEVDDVVEAIREFVAEYERATGS